MQRAGLESLWQNVLRVLADIAPDGQEVANVLLLALQRERNWIQWKKDSCPAFERAVGTESVSVIAGTKRRAPEV